MINIKPGEIWFSNIAQSIHPKMKKRDFLSTQLKCKIVRDESHGKTGIYVLDDLSLWNKSVSVIVIFDQSETIDMVKFTPYTWSNPADEWSQEKAINRKLKNDKYLNNNLGPPPYKYEWGCIESCYDPRSCSSLISVLYY
jgi:hypothetical protein